MLGFENGVITEFRVVFFSQSENSLRDREQWMEIKGHFSK